MKSTARLAQRHGSAVTHRDLPGRRSPRDVARRVAAARRRSVRPMRRDPPAQAAVARLGRLADAGLAGIDLVAARGTRGGVRFGMTTFAPRTRPSSRPSSRFSVASAVVLGMFARGQTSRASAITL